MKCILLFGPESFAFHLLLKNITIKINKIIVLPVV
jgi:hypothetical protein